MEKIKTYLSLLDCLLWENIAINTSEHCKKGDVISIRGRIQSRIDEKDGERLHVQEIVGERVTFISSMKEKDKEISENVNK